MIWLAVVALSCAIAYAARTFRVLHMLQLDGYRVERYLRHSWENRSAKQAVVPGIAALSLVAIWALARWSVPFADPVSALFALAESVALAAWVWTRPLKKPPVFTGRLKRIAAVSALLAVVAGWLGSFAVLAGSELAVTAAYALGSLIVVAAPMLATATVVVLEPLESTLRHRFIRKAGTRLAEVAPIVIGVTGSYGKTTTKAALAAVLSSRYKVFATPESYNTLLGVTRAINEQLEDGVEVFIVEMGAREPGDIEEICRLVKPSVGVITRLGAQHLEYFKTPEAITRTKTELLRSLPSDGLAVVDVDGLSDFLPPHDWKARTLRVSSRGEAGAEFTVQNVTVSGQGTTFEVAGPGGSAIEASTRLLGRHAAANSALAVVVGLELGLEPQDIRQGLAKMEPVPHRLEIVRSDSVTVIDDAFNSNPEGFAAALEVLGSFPGRRILVTPGMVELGSQTVSAHVKIAEVAATTSDIVIVVGKNAPREFVTTLAERGLAGDAIILADSLAHATEIIGRMVRAGDVVLFENDLPDNFG